MILLVLRTGEEFRCHRAFADQCGSNVFLDIERQPELAVDLLVSSCCEAVTGGSGRDQGEERISVLLFDSEGDSEGRRALTEQAAQSSGRI